ncbi:unnamed protein product [Lampetra fluviatilis]
MTPVMATPMGAAALDVAADANVGPWNAAVAVLAAAAPAVTSSTGCRGYRGCCGSATRCRGCGIGVVGERHGRATLQSAYQQMAAVFQPPSSARLKFSVRQREEGEWPMAFHCSLLARAAYPDLEGRALDPLALERLLGLVV